MVQSSASTVEGYLAELPEDRRQAIETVRQVVTDNLPDGYVETMNWGMISYEIPLERYPKTYNGQPLAYIALGSQKQYMTLYLNAVHTSEEGTETFRQRYEAAGKKLDMGKSCVRFKRLDDLPLDVIADTVASVGVDDYIAVYESARGLR